MVNIHIINTESSFYPQVLELRDAILRKPLGMSLKNDDLSKDKEATIIIAENENRVIGCLLLLVVNEKTLQLRAMAVSEQWQNKGIGSTLVNAAEIYTRTTGFSNIILHARKVALGFYEKSGYSILSNEFTEVGIPHYIMGKDIAVK